MASSISKTKAVAVFVLIVGTGLYLITEYFSPEREWQKHHRSGLAAYKQKKYTQAEKHLTKALQDAEQFPPGDPRLSQTLGNLIEIIQIQGKFAEAEPYLRRKLLIAEERYGPDHPQVAAHLNNLAENYRAQTKYEEAEPLLKRSLTILEKTLGPENPLTVFALEKYFNLLKLMKNDEEALKYGALLQKRQPGSNTSPHE